MHKYDLYEVIVFLSLFPSHFILFYFGIGLIMQLAIFFK